MLGVKRGRQSFTFEYKLKVIARADNFVTSRISFVFGCGLSASAGNLLNFFSCYCKKWPMRVIYCAGNRPEITVHFLVFCCVCVVAINDRLFLFLFLLDLGSATSCCKWISVIKRVVFYHCVSKRQIFH